MLRSVRYGGARGGIWSMAVLFFLQPESSIDGMRPARSRAAEPCHSRWAFACIVTGVMALLPGMANAYQAKDFSKEISPGQAFFGRQNYLMPSAANPVGVIPDGDLPDAPTRAEEASVSGDLGSGASVT